MSKDLKTQTQDDDSDFDDDLLDEVLDDMSQLPTTAPAAVKNEIKDTDKTICEDPAEQSLDDMLDNDDFAKQLAEGMKQLMGQMGSLEQDEATNKTFEEAWNSSKTAAASSAPSTTEKGPKGPLSFQETIDKTMNKLKDSNQEINNSMAEEPDDAFMAELMKQMESLTDNGEFEGVLEGMMNQLMSKDLLYEPMKDLAVKYPAWLTENKGKVADTDYEKYNQQYEVCKEIVAKYEAPSFDEKNEEQSKAIMDLMTKMQDLGQPPADLLDGMAPGMNFGNPESMPDMKDMENCTIM